jgi:hypothetical protein
VSPNLAKTARKTNAFYFFQFLAQKEKKDLHFYAGLNQMT